MKLGDSSTNKQHVRAIDTDGMQKETAGGKSTVEMSSLSRSKQQETKAHTHTR